MIQISNLHPSKRIQALGLEGSQVYQSQRLWFGLYQSLQARSLHRDLPTVDYNSIPPSPVRSKRPANPL